jgi:sterol 24-C-methyltransferase
LYQSTIDFYDKIYEGVGLGESLDEAAKKSAAQAAAEGGKQDGIGSSAQEMTDRYYNIATDFYEYGWGSSFHFAPRKAGESLADSISRYEKELAEGLKRGGDFGDGLANTSENNLSKSTNQSAGEAGSDTAKIPPKKILDLGMGIGGPMRSVTSHFKGVDFVGMTLNEYQVQRCKDITARK